MSRVFKVQDAKNYVKFMINWKNEAAPKLTASSSAALYVYIMYAFK